MKVFASAFLLILVPVLAAGAHVDLSAKYPFQQTLFNDLGQFYNLHWNYSTAAQTIHFAVNVSTTGWVGFGISPNGQMPGSDVVIGWVSAADGRSYFHDRFADGRALPPIDDSQDWFLSNSEEENGYTVLEFSRNMTSCDPRDLDIGVGTARVIWSFNLTDPTDPLGETAKRHDYQGSLSLNLLGGLPSPPSSPNDLESFDLRLSNVTIPSASTTYWCKSFELPAEVRAETKYVTRVTPVIEPHLRSFVHHMLVYQCITPLNETFLGQSGPCNDVAKEVSACRRGVLISGWAIGGEDFVYPENVALPIGGPGAQHHIVIEMHYDNPMNQEGVIDDSGMRYFYTSEAREHDAGIMFLGHAVTPIMLVPPRTDNYTIGSVCTADCTQNYIPEGGIRIIANFLHTHLVGRALELQHLRWNSDCQVYEELPPIDLNPNYDFNFQQYTHLPNEVTILPGDILILKCYYDTSKNTNVTYGGESTLEEMCLTFPVYYPRPKDRNNLDFCISYPIFPETYADFGTKYLPRNPEAAQLYAQQKYLEAFNAVNWTPETVQDLQSDTLNGRVGYSCSSASDQGIRNTMMTGLPQSNCSYEAADKCTGFQPLSCCERLAAAGEATLATQLNLVIILCSALISAMCAATV